MLEDRKKTEMDEPDLTSKPELEMSDVHIFRYRDLAEPKPGT